MVKGSWRRAQHAILARVIRGENVVLCRKLQLRARALRGIQGGFGIRVGNLVERGGLQIEGLKLCLQGESFSMAGKDQFKDYA